MLKIREIQVSEILEIKGDTLYTATPDTSVRKAVSIMSSHDIGSLVIMEPPELVGIVTFREIIQLLQNYSDKPDETPLHVVMETSLRTIMDDAPISVSPNTSAQEVQRLMLEKHARYIPVIDGGKLKGVISFYDMAQAIVKAQQFENNMLKAFIRKWPKDNSPLKEDETPEDTPQTHNKAPKSRKPKRNEPK